MSCNRQPEKGDVDLTGVWFAEIQDRQSLLVLKADGTYECTVALRTGAAQKLEGRWRVKDSVFTETMIRHSNTNAPFPVTSRAKIIAWSKDALSLQYEGDTTAIVFRRKPK